MDSLVSESTLREEDVSKLLASLKLHLEESPVPLLNTSLQDCPDSREFYAVLMASA